MTNLCEWEKIPYLSERDMKTLTKHVNRRRSNSSKSQYIRGLAYDMLHSDELELNKKGEELMLKMIEQYPNEKYAVMTGHLILGKYYRSISDYTNAIAHYRTVMEYNHSMEGMSIGLPEMDIATTIIQYGNTDDYDYAKKVMTFVDPRKLFIEREKQQYRVIMNELYKQ